MVASFYVDPNLVCCTGVTRHVLLARHASHAEVGHVLSGRSDIGLSEQGRAEAERLARHLAGTPLAAIHASPRRRTRETAEIVAARHDLPVALVDALDEIDFGDWTGRSFAALDDDPAWRRWNAMRGSAATPGGETMADVASRAVRHIETNEGEGPVLCVSHCDVIRGVIAHYRGLNPDGLLQLACDPASLTTIALDGKAGRVLTLNEQPA